MAVSSSRSALFSSAMTLEFPFMGTEYDKNQFRGQTLLPKESGRPHSLVNFLQLIEEAALL